MCGYGSVCGAVWETVRLSSCTAYDDVKGDWVSPLVRGSVEMVGAVVPKDCCDVVFGCRLDDEVVVTPACGCLGCDRTCVPFTDYDYVQRDRVSWNICFGTEISLTWHISKVTPYGREVGVDSGLEKKVSDGVSPGRWHQPTLSASEPQIVFPQAENVKSYGE